MVSVQIEVLEEIAVSPDKTKLLMMITTVAYPQASASPIVYHV